MNATIEKARSATHAAGLGHTGTLDAPIVPTAAKGDNPGAELMSLNCPPAMRRLEGWVLWRFEEGDGPKPRKVPYYADGGRRKGVQGAREDRLRMVAFDAARSAAARRGFDGIGLCLLPEFGVVCVDFDNVVGPDGLRPDVAAVVSDTFAEFSPSGRGVHAYYLGNLGNHKSHGEPFGLETFSTSGFVTFTGNPLPHVGDLELAGPVDLVPVSQDMQAMYAGRFGSRAAPGIEDDDPLMNYSPRLELTEAEVGEALEVLDPDTGHDEWLRVGMALHHELGEDGFTHWDQWSAGGSKYPGTEVLQSRWDSFGRQRGRSVTGASLVKMANAAGARIKVGAGLVKALPPRTLALPPAPTWAQAMALPRTPPCIVEGYLWQQVGMLNSIGGVGKTTLVLFEAVHIALGLPLHGRRVLKPGPVLYVTAEDDAGELLAALRDICMALMLDQQQMDAVLQAVRFLDVTRNPVRLVANERDLIRADESIALEVARVAREIGAVLVVVDPLISFGGGGDTRPNDVAQALIEAARIIMIEAHVCVRCIHHVAKGAGQAAKGDADVASSPHMGRGGSALGDGARMVHNLQSMTPERWLKATGTPLPEGAAALEMRGAKIRYAAPERAPLYLLRIGDLFETVEPQPKPGNAPAQQSADARELLDYLVEATQSQVITKTSLRDNPAQIGSGWTQKRAREALDVLGRHQCIAMVKPDGMTPATSGPGVRLKVLNSGWQEPPPEVGLDPD